MRTASVVFALLFSVSLFAQQFPSNVDLSRQIPILVDGMDIRAIAVDATGNVYIAGTSSQGFPGATSNLGPRGKADMFVIKLNNNLDQVIYAASIGGSETESVRSIKVDATGNAYIIGGTASANFPATKRFFELNPTGSVVLKLNPAGTGLAYAAVLGTRISALAFDVDANGAAYIAGSAHAQDLPATPGVLRPGPPSNVDPDAFLGFVAKLNPGGTQWELATYYGPENQWVEALALRGSNVVVLANGSLVTFNTGLSQEVSNVAAGIKPGTLQFDATGNVYVSGTSTAAGGGFALKKYSPTGTPINLAQVNLGLSTASANVVPRVTVTGAGQIYLFGTPAGSNLATRNATQTCLANIAPPSGTAGLFSTETGGGLIGGVGNNGIGDDQALVILDAGGAVVHSSFFSSNVALAAVSPTSGRIYAAASQRLYGNPRSTWRGVIRLNQDAIPTAHLAPSCVVHGATFDIVPLSPGTLMTVFGSNLGPGTPDNYLTGASFQLENGKIPTTLGGVSITVDGRPAPMLFSWTSQLNFIVPWQTPADGRVVQVCITYQAANQCFAAGTAPAIPGVFQFDAGSAAARSTALNQDGSINGPNAPAPRGSVVALFMTGGGRWNGEMIDGGVPGTAIFVNATVSAIYSPTGSGCTLFGCDSFPASANVPVEYAGAAPGLASGVVQVNLRIPNDMTVGNNQTFVLSFQVPGELSPVIAIAKLSVKQ